MDACRRPRVLVVTAGAILVACAGASPSLPAARAPRDAPPSSKPVEGPVTFDDDVAFLAKHGEHVEILDCEGGGSVAVSTRYQGRVMTSAIGPGGRSLGFLHRAFIEAGKTGTKFDNYGGEDRFWLGPEGGQFGLFFPRGKPFAFAEWQTPADMQEGAWDLDRDGNVVVLTHRMRVANWTGTPFTVDVVRTVRPLAGSEVAKELGVSIPPGVSWVAFQSENQITNAGDAPWSEATGLLSVWILGMFAPAKDARIVIPFDAKGDGPIVNDRYFGKVPADRLAVHKREGFLVLSADGTYRSKIGLGPSRARQVAGSYSASERLLTLVQYDRSAGAKRYVNSMWETQREPYGGDVVNAYNDGPTEPGKPSLGGFYELETSSPAAALTPRASLVHTHRTFHFVGPRAALDAIATRVLGVSLDAVVAP